MNQIEVILCHKRCDSATGRRLWMGSYTNVVRKGASSQIYGQLSINGKVYTVHRLAMMVAKSSEQLPSDQAMHKLTF